MCFCDQPAEYGGETPIIDSTELYHYVHSHFPKSKQKTNKGVKYTRVIPDEDDKTSPIGRSWKNTYAVETKEELEKKLSNEGYEYEWISTGVRVSSPVLSAFSFNTQTKQVVFFNSIIAAHFGWQDTRNDRLKAVTFGDGTPISIEFLESVRSYSQKIAKHWQWQSGDSYGLITIKQCSRLPYHGQRSLCKSLEK